VVAAHKPGRGPRCMGIPGSPHSSRPCTARMRWWPPCQSDGGRHCRKRLSLRPVPLDPSELQTFLGSMVAAMVKSNLSRVFCSHRSFCSTEPGPNSRSRSWSRKSYALLRGLQCHHRHMPHRIHKRCWFLQTVANRCRNHKSHRSHNWSCMFRCGHEGSGVQGYARRGEARRRGGRADQLSSQLIEEIPRTIPPTSCRRSRAPSTPPVIADSCDERDASCALSSDGSTQPWTVESIIARWTSIAYCGPRIDLC